MIPILVSEIKSDKSLHPFMAKNKKLNGVKCYPIWIMRPDLESSHHFAYLRHLLDMIFTFLFFDLPCIFKILQTARASTFQELKKIIAGLQWNHPGFFSGGRGHDPMNYLLEMSSSSPRVTLRVGRRARAGLLRGLTWGVRGSACAA